MIKDKQWRRRMGLIFSWILMSSLIGCGKGVERKALTKYSEVQSLMGTIVRLDACMESGQEGQLRRVYEQVWSRLEEIAWRMNVLDSNSDVAKINQATGEAVQVGFDTYQVLQASQGWTQVTQGAFDITVWPLIAFWRTQAQQGQWPSSQEVTEVLHRVGMHHVQLLENDSVKLDQEGVQVDLGGIAKGYAVDEAARIFRAHGFKRFYIDAGGDIYVGGYNCLGHRWRIGIKDPQDPAQVMDVVLLKDQAVATSGNYEQYMEIEGQRWSHIIDPHTGYPQQGVVSATVIAPKALDADALATAMTVLGPKEGNALINRLGLMYGSLIHSQAHDGQSHQHVASRQYQSWRQQR